MKSIIKKCIGRSIRVIPKLKSSLMDGLTVFNFHEVTDEPSRFAAEFGLSVSNQTFYRQVKWIQSNFNVIHPSALLNNAPLPEKAVMITFDDGFLGSFENGLSILKKLGLPSVHFLNMRAIVEQKPIISAIAWYLKKFIPEFSEFAKLNNLSAPFHLNLTPSLFSNFEKSYGGINLDDVLDYQGKFAGLDVVEKWDGSELVVYGNHLYDHWNASSLETEEFKEQFLKNEKALSCFKNKVNLFAFPNGNPKTSFSDREIGILKQLGVGKIFSATGGINRDTSKFLIGRLHLSEHVKDEDFIWYSMGRAVIS